VTHEVIVPNRREFLSINRQPFLDEAEMPAHGKTLDAVCGGVRSSPKRTSGQIVQNWRRLD
jgi:hypothetical protein